jgi:hypothetical protein
MLQSLLSRLRPVAETAAAIADALAEARVAQAAVADRRRALESGRGAALLGDGKAAEAHESAIAETEREADRLAAILVELDRRHAEAMRREAREMLEKQAAEAAAACRSAAAGIKRDWPKVAGELLRMMAAEREAEEMRERLERAILAAGEAAAGIEVPPLPRMIYGGTTVDGMMGAGLHRRVALPAIDPATWRDEAPPAWPRP